MSTRFEISARDDPRLDAFAGVREPEALVRSGHFLLEGRLLVAQALREGTARVEQLLLTPTAEQALGQILEDAPAEVTRYVVPASLMREATGFRFHQGCLGLARRPAEPSLDAVLGGAGGSDTGFLLLERVTSPDNLGTLFRTAAAFGVRALLLSPGCADPWYRKCVRTSMGAVLRMPFVTIDDWLGTLEVLRRREVRVVALDPAGSLPLDSFVAKPHSGPVAFLLGNEGEGLSPGARSQAAEVVSIPIDRTVDSLNVAAAGAVALYAWRAARRGS